MKKKFVSGMTLTLLMLGMLTLAFNIQPVKAQQTATLETILFSYSIYVPAREVRAPNILLTEGTNVRIEFNASEPIDFFCQDSGEYSRSAASGWVLIYYHWSNKTAHMNTTYTIPTTDTWYFTLANYEYHDVDVYNITLYQLTTYEIRVVSDKKYYHTGEQATLTANVTRDYEAAPETNVTLQVLDPSGNVVLNQSGYTNAYGQVVGTFILPSDEGTYIATAQAIINGKTIQDSIFFAIDETPPVINIISPENGTSVIRSVSLVFNINEPTSWIGYSLNDHVNVTITQNTTLSLSRGAYNIVVYATDMAGNTGHSGKICFEVAPYIDVDQSYVSDDGADVGSIQTVGFHAKWDNGSQVVGGSIYVNGTEYITNSTGWVTFNVSSPIFGKEEWAVTQVSCMGIISYVQTALNACIFWGGAKVFDWQLFFYWDGYGLPDGSKFFFEPAYEWWQIRWHCIPFSNGSYYLGFEVYIYKEAVDMYFYYCAFDTEGRTEGQYRFMELGRFMVIVHLANIEYVELFGERLDDAPPITSVSYDSAWRRTDFTITLTAVDTLFGYSNRGSGLLDTYYRINDRPYQSVSTHGLPLITSEGTDNTLEYWSVDKAGNVEAPKIITGIKLDKTAPTILITSPDSGSEINSSTVIITWTGSNELSGISYYEISLDDSSWFNVGTNTTHAFTQLSDGTHTVDIRGVDKAGNARQETISFVVSISLLFGPSYMKEAAIIATASIIALAVVLLYFLKIRKPKSQQPFPQQKPS